jgi:hypothetical protein
MLPKYLKHSTFSSWTDRVKCKDVYHRDTEEWNILHTIIPRKTNRTGHILRRNCLLKHVIEYRTRRRGRICKQLRDDFMENRRQWDLKQKTPDRTVCRTHLGETMCLSQDRLCNLPVHRHKLRETFRSCLSKEILPLAAQVLNVTMSRPSVTMGNVVA